jgi:hypothetical protein
VNGIPVTTPADPFLTVGEQFRSGRALPVMVRGRPLEH